MLYSISVKLTAPTVAMIDRIAEDAWVGLEDYPETGEAQIAETTVNGERLIVPARPAPRPPSATVPKLAPLRGAHQPHRTTRHR